MADIFDPLEQAMAAVQAVINADQVTVSQQIRGLEDLTQVSFSADALTDVRAVLTKHANRRDLLQNMVNGMSSVHQDISDLRADGYPGMARIDISPEVAKELQEERADLLAALNEFAAPEAGKLVIALGQPVPKD